MKRTTLAWIALAACASAQQTDWLLDDSAHTASIERTAGELALDNGLVRRVLRVADGLATVRYDCVVTGEALLRAVRPEARVTLDDVDYPIGGLLGQPQHGYLTREWLAAMTLDPAAFELVGTEVGPTLEHFPWKRSRWCEDRPWPPPGRRVAFSCRAPRESEHAGFEVTVHYELYDGLPLTAKWLTLVNGTDRPVRVDSFTADILAAVEHSADKPRGDAWDRPPIHVSTSAAKSASRC